MKKVLLSIIIFLGFIPTITLAQESPEGILPDSGVENCDETLEGFYAGSQTAEYMKTFNANPDLRKLILGCAVKTGRIELWMVPYFITYFVQFLLSIAASICILFIMVGAYHYIFGGISDEKEKGKNTIKYALMGFVVVMIAWILVNFVQVQVTR